MCVCVCVCIYIMYILFTTERFLEVAIESCPEWDLNPRPLNPVQTLQPIKLSGHEFNSHFVQLLQFHLLFIVRFRFYFSYCLRQLLRLFNGSFIKFYKKV